MDKEESIREQKQNYLEDQIVNKGYDTTAFLNYLTELRGETGIDIDNWEYLELKKVHHHIVIIYFLGLLRFC